MRYKTFGKTGMQVSEMALGTWGIGGAGWDDNPAEVRMDAIRAAYESGINFIDTAPAYNAGAAERCIGEALKDLGIRREMLITTKCGNEFINGQYVRCGSAEKILRECEESLRNLQTDYIDLYLVHWPDPNVPMEETMEAVARLKKEGKILHAGVSNFTKDQIMEASKYCEVEAFQPQYSMIVRDNEDLMKWACAQGIGIMAYGTLGGGILTGAYRQLRTYDTMDNRNRFYKHFQEPMFSRVQAFLKVLDGISEARGGVPLSQITMNWSLSRDFISSCIIGCQSRAKVEQNCRAFDWSLTQEEIDLIDRAIEQWL